ncbi:hypothetical protein PF008_g28646 [Phytophthora fragariae]|uniref:Uncharacterized protein n=1 Tax=Phytophthora fragariae TaxID=53985 RepID=A0A6G0QAV2_9STRA|nr:hypothetical protein PF003_g40551 [Phytophthora fragariae]KAE9278307.1 hypothetical protein PF008_g28646 [Phytophthora fragariae]
MASAVRVPTEIVGAVTHVGRELTVSFGRRSRDVSGCTEPAVEWPHIPRYRFFQAKVHLESRQAQES